MIARKYETVVGVFVVFSLIALMIMVMIIARQEGLFQDYVEYRTVFKNVSGLKTGSEVHLAGVTVGNVTEITINPDGTIVVTFKVLEKYSTQIRWDSKASIGFMGLLGEKSLDLTPGDASAPPIPPEGFVASVEPLDITSLLARAGPSLGDLQKVLDNLVVLTDGLRKPESDFAKIVQNLRDAVTKINEGTGSLGRFINDPAFYKEATQTAAEARKLLAGLEQSKGLLGTLLGDAKFKEQAQKTLDSLQVSMGNLSQATGELKEASTRLPAMATKLDSFLTNLNRAGKNLPGLVTEGETLMSDADKAAKAAQKTWLLRRHVPAPREHTIRMDAGPGKD